MQLFIPLLGLATLLCFVEESSEVAGVHGPPKEHILSKRHARVRRVKRFNPDAAFGGSSGRFYLPSNPSGSSSASSSSSSSSAKSAQAKAISIPGLDNNPITGAINSFNNKIQQLELAGKMLQAAAKLASEGLKDMSSGIGGILYPERAISSG